MTERRRIDHWRNKSWASPCLFAMKSLAVHQGNSRDPANPVKSLRRERERVRDETKVTLMPTGNQKRKDASTREEKPKCVGGKIPPIPIIYLFDKSEWSDQRDDVQDFDSRIVELLFCHRCSSGRCRQPNIHRIQFHFVAHSTPLFSAQVLLTISKIIFRLPLPKHSNSERRTFTLRRYQVLPLLLTSLLKQKPEKEREKYVLASRRQSQSGVFNCIYTIKVQCT